MTTRLVLLAALVTLTAACNSPYAGDATPDGNGRVFPTDGTTPPETENPFPETTRPGVPGSPIDYDSTIGGGARTIAYVTSYIEGQLDEKCATSPVRRCGITIVPLGDEDCVGEVRPNPVTPGETIELITEPCPEETTEEPLPTTDEPTTTEGWT